jgi:hypothetical protein
MAKRGEQIEMILSPPLEKKKKNGRKAQEPLDCLPRMGKLALEQSYS